MLASASERATVPDSALATAPFRYRAFLSYSHRDTPWAKWLHRALENYRIDKDLVGRETANGPVPKTLRPIFRDREDFSGGHILTDATVTALDASAALIVLCSTVAGTRPVVNEEVRLFRSRHPDRPVIPIIIDGKWPENFPPALRYEVAADGTVTDHRVTILGPDLREGGDGKNLGLAKTVAGLTGLAPDDIFRRAERARKRRNRYRVGIAGVGILLVGSAVAGWAGAVSFSARLDYEEQLTIKSDTANVCERASDQAEAEDVPEVGRVAFAVKCVKLLSDGLDELSQKTLIPLTFIDSFEANVAILRKFKDAGQLTPQQLDVLDRAENLLAQLKKGS